MSRSVKNLRLFGKEVAHNPQDAPPGKKRKIREGEFPNSRKTSEASLAGDFTLSKSHIPGRDLERRRRGGRPGKRSRGTSRSRGPSPRSRLEKRKGTP